MNDANMTDSLLEELEQLEASSEALDEQLAHNRKQQHQATQLSPASTLDAATLALEAAKTAQEAATHSQKAAEASLNHSHRQKEQVIELSDANYAWRQAVKTATHELHSTQKRFAIMLGVSVFTSLAAVSALGWMLYSMNSKEAQFKGEVLDLIQTENILHGKQITVKVDEISSLLELLAAEVKKITPQQSATVASAVMANPAEIPANAPAEPSPLVDLHTEAETPADDTHAIAAAGGEPTVQTEAHSDDHSVAPASDEMTSPALAAETPVAAKPDESEIKALIEQILQAQQQLQSQMHLQAGHAAVTQNGGGLTDAQQKQLNDIGWLVKKQAKLLDEIKHNLQNLPAPVQSGKGKSAESANYQAIQTSLEELKAQMANLKTQQSALQEQVKALQAQTEKLSAAPKPYSYRIQN
ncbi:hypothetical protein [Thiomicrorhabdus cannonii]|uniref:hypothetical protein n=1 Tax=Thiomicrorhabdus cannonii TaxID=2748011 RepID=UPI0015BB5081|nr:hypothetical protein [Thiomicrorhabdus cannonii]